jgi:hypothetical protein
MVLVGRSIVRSSVSIRGRTDPRRLWGDGGRSLSRVSPRRFMFGVLPALAMGGVLTGDWGRGGSIERTEPEKRRVLSSSSPAVSNTRGRSLGRRSAAR